MRSSSLYFWRLTQRRKVRCFTPVIYRRTARGIWMSYVVLPTYD